MERCRTDEAGCGLRIEKRGRALSSQPHHGESQVQAFVQNRVESEPEHGVHPLQAFCQKRWNLLRPLRRMGRKDAGGVSSRNEVCGD